LQTLAILGRQVVTVGLDLELSAASAEVLDHPEEVWMDHRLATRGRQVGDLELPDLIEDTEDLTLRKLVGKRFAGTALLYAVQAREVALVGDLPCDVERRAEFGRAFGLRGRRRRVGRHRGFSHVAPPPAGLFPPVR